MGLFSHGAKTGSPPRNAEVGLPVATVVEKHRKNAQKLHTPMGECSPFFKNEFSERFWVRFALCGIQHRVSSPCFRRRSRRVLATGRPRDRLLAVSPPKTATSPEHRSSERRVSRRWIGFSVYYQLSRKNVLSKAQPVAATKRHRKSKSSDQNRA